MDKRQAIFLLIGIIIIGAAAGWWRAKHRETLPPVKLCYTRNTEDGGHADIAMRISNGRAIGEFSYIPSEKDSMKGPFRGTVSDANGGKMFAGIWTVSAEGKVMKQELWILLSESTATPGFGEMIDRGDGTYVYAHPDSISYDAPLSLVDCSDKAFRL